MKNRLEELPWTLFIDESSNKTQCGVGILLESPHGVVLRKALMIEFPLKNNRTVVDVLGGLHCTEARHLPSVSNRRSPAGLFYENCTG